LLGSAAGLLIGLNGCGGGGSANATPGTPTASQKIQHVVVIFQENRTPDNLFHDPKLISAGADIASSGMDSQGNQLALTPVSLVTAYDLSHKHDAFEEMYDGGKMDGADKIATFCGLTPPPNCVPPNPQFQYVDNSTGELQPYFDLAETYTFGDRMFQTNQGPSYPAHQFIVSGTSVPSPGSSFFVAENPIGPADAVQHTGCTAPANETVALIDSSGVEITDRNDSRYAQYNIYPCLDHPTLTDLLDSHNLSWRYYTPTEGSLWTAPTAIEHICVPNASKTACTGADWTSKVILNPPQVLTDISANQLPSVSWIIPDAKESDHAMINDGSGPSWVASIVNAIGSSQYWSNTAIIIAWDDWGGWYDHVPPPSIVNSYEYGFRVPLIVVSPYAKSAHISHQVHDFGSILKFIETVFNLPTVAPGYADTRADDLSDCFDFGQTPLAFHTIAAKYGATHFLEDRSPPQGPDDDN
jgi:phospholipase C